MGLLTTWWLLLLASVGILSTSTSTDVSIETENLGTLYRLATIEATLEVVLRKSTEQEKIIHSVQQKNAELEKRVEVLEDENERLNCEVAFLKKIGDNQSEYPDNFIFNVPGGPRKKYIDCNLMNDGRDSLDCHRDTRDAGKEVQAGCKDTLDDQREILNAATDISDFGKDTMNDLTGRFEKEKGKDVYTNLPSVGVKRQLHMTSSGGEFVGFTATSGEHIMYITVSRTVLLHLRQGGEVWIRTRNSTNNDDGAIFYGDYSSFSGWLVAVAT